jgi:hypothetical protein
MQNCLVVQLDLSFGHLKLVKTKSYVYQEFETEQTKHIFKS